MTQLSMGLAFYPRGGSAQVARYLGLALQRAGRSVELVTGSLGEPGAESNAATFFAGLDVRAADFTPAVRAWEHGGDPMDQPMPMQPSFEDRDGVPDRWFPFVDDRLARRQIDAWGDQFAAAGADDIDVFHLHHLTPQHLAVAERWPERPVVAHLHGTELKMLDRLAPGEPWFDRLVGAAQHARALIAISAHDRDEAVRLLGVPIERITVVPNGVDLTRFDRQDVSADERLARWRRWLVEDPQGWDQTGEPGTIRYTDDALSGFVDDGGDPVPVLLFVGRFLGFKRVPLLVRAYAQARQQMAVPAPLVIWGGSPGEWEGEHPATVARALGVEGVFFAGWRGHNDLVDGLNAADVLVAPSVDEPFGQVYLEAMACGLPVIATTTGGPPAFVNTESTQPNGWLIPPDDSQALTQAMVEAINDPVERIARGRHGYAQIRRSYSWDTIAQQVVEVYDQVLD